MDYSVLKMLHIVLAMLSLCGFMLRWTWMRTGSILFQHRLTRILPHAVDTLFLVTGVWLTLAIQQFPPASTWLNAKLVGLVAYIVLGSLALKRARTSRGRLTAFLASLLVFVWIVSVALLKNAWGFVSMI